MSEPTESIWHGLLDGDPGPTVALFDALIDGDLAHAAGGMLRDIAERLRDIHDHVEQPHQRERFATAARKALVCCLNGDQAAVEALLRETASSEPDELF